MSLVNCVTCCQVSLFLTVVLAVTVIGGDRGELGGGKLVAAVAILPIGCSASGAMIGCSSSAAGAEVRAHAGSVSGCPDVDRCSSAAGAEVSVLVFRAVGRCTAW